MSSYYCLVAGLPDVALDGSKSAYTVERFKEDIYPELSAADAACVDLFFLERDNANILNLLRHGEDARIEQYGCYSREELEEIISSAKEGDAPLEGVPSYIYGFLGHYFANEGNVGAILEDLLGSYYFDYATKCANSFVAEWFVFNRNVNNILVALTARKYKMDIAAAVIGDDEVAEALRTSGARDFGLTSMLDCFENVQRIADNSRLQERERQLDDMRCRWLDDNSVFNYFTVERLFVFLLKLSIIERWAKLDADKGMQRYNELIAELKSGMDSQSVEL